MTVVWEAVPQLVDELKQYWCEGLSASNIARKLGHGLSRSAIIGKVHRLGLSDFNRATPTLRVRNLANGPRPKPLKLAVPVDINEPEPQVDENGAPITVLNARDSHCRWVHGYVGTNSFRYCGKATVKGSFCDYHSGKAYEPPHKKAAEA